MFGKTFIVLATIALIFALGIQLGLSKEEQPSVDTAQIISRLNEVLANQDEIFEQLEQIKQELAIIKIRATR